MNMKYDIQTTVFNMLQLPTVLTARRVCVHACGMKTSATRECGNNSSGSIKYVVFPDELGTCWFLRKDSAPWSFIYINISGSLSHLGFK